MREMCGSVCQACVWVRSPMCVLCDLADRPGSVHSSCYETVSLHVKLKLFNYVPPLKKSFINLVKSEVLGLSQDQAK